MGYQAICQACGPDSNPARNGKLLDHKQPSCWEIAVHLAFAGDVFDGVFLYFSFSHEMAWVRSETLLSPAEGGGI